MILIYILEFFPGKKFTFWEFFPGKNNFDLHFGIFPEILKLFPREKEREKFQNVNFSPLQIGTFSFPGWKRFFPVQTQGIKK